MIRHTFAHIPGVGSHIERSLWQAGCLTWDDYLSDPDQFSIGSASRDLVNYAVKKSQEALAAQDADFFATEVQAKDIWRLWGEFPNSTVYLDIETDGRMSPDAITTIGMYDGESFICLVKGQDLDQLADVLSRYKMVVTFYGSSFDIPMIKRAFRGVKVPPIHLDLCTALRKLGYRGGLKKIEKQVGLARGSDTDGLSGLDAIRLWREYQAGREQSLKTLIAYNREDVVNLEGLCEICYQQSRNQLLNEAGLVDFAH